MVESANHNVELHIYKIFLYNKHDCTFYFVIIIKQTYFDAVKYDSNLL